MIIIILAAGLMVSGGCNGSAAALSGANLGVADLQTLTSPQFIVLTDNDSIPCADLALLTSSLPPGVVIEPEPGSCIPKGQVK